MWAEEKVGTPLSSTGEDGEIALLGLFPTRIYRRSMEALGDQAETETLGNVSGDPGYIYIVEDHGRFKIGKTGRTAERMRAAKTWLPDMKILACKPFWNVSQIERDLHAGFSVGWYSGEWFALDDCDRDILLEGFSEFSDDDRDANTANFVRWCNSDGMVESIMECDRQARGLKPFLDQESFSKKVK